MVARRKSVADTLRYFTLILTLSAQINADGYEGTCPKGAVIDLTEEIKDSSGSLEKSGDIFTPEITWTKNERTLGCACSFKMCLLLCCPLGKARTEGTCVNDNVTSATFPAGNTTDIDDSRYSRPENFSVFTDDPCAVGWMTPYLLESFSVLVNGSIYSPDFDGGSISNFEHYCLFREPESSVYLAKVCRPLTWAVYDIVCLIIAIIIMLAIIVGYTIVPELRNLHGLIFRSYIATYIGTYVCSIVAQLTIESRTYAQLYSFFVFIGHYTAISCAFWLNVMSFDIWRAFRNMRSIENVTKEREMKKFVWYGIFAWVIPGILVTTCVAIIRYVPYFLNDTFGETFKQWTTVGVIIIIYVCNSIMYTATALRIRRHKKDTAQLADGVNKHHDMNKQWFNLHVKLFLIMGGHMVMWALWVIWPTGVMTRLLLTLEIIQCFLIFMIFLWKDNVKRSIRERVQKTLASMNQSLNSGESTRTAES